MAQVEIQAGPHRFVSLLSREAADELGLEPGVLAVATIKATNVSVEIPASPTDLAAGETLTEEFIVRRFTVIAVALAAVAVAGCSSSSSGSSSSRLRAPAPSRPGRSPSSPRHR